MSLLLHWNRTKARWRLAEQDEACRQGRWGGTGTDTLRYGILYICQAVQIIPEKIVLHPDARGPLWCRIGLQQGMLQGGIGLLLLQAEADSPKVAERC